MLHGFCFKHIHLHVSSCIRFLNKWGIDVNGVHLCDQYVQYRSLKSLAGLSDMFDSLLHEHLSSYFLKMFIRNQLLRAAVIVLGKSVSQFTAQWSKERNRLPIGSVRGILRTHISSPNDSGVHLAEHFFMWLWWSPVFTHSQISRKRWL